MSRFATGVVSALAGAVCWGFSGTCMQFVFERTDVPVLFVCAWRMTIAGVLLCAFLLATRRDALTGIARDRRSLASVCVFGLVGLFFCQLSYMYAIDWTNAGTATVLQAANVIFVLGISCIRSRRTPRAHECLAVACALAATVLIATKGDLSTLAIPLPGLVWGLASAAAVCFYVVWPAKLFKRWGSPAVTGAGMLVGGIAAWVALAATEFGGDGAALSWTATLDATAWAFLVVIALVGTLASFGLYLYGVSIVGGVKGSLLGTVEPAAACIIACVWLDTAFTWADWTGMILMIATVFIVSTRET